jgi:hypothetical protein
LRTPVPFAFLFGITVAALSGWAWGGENKLSKTGAPEVSNRTLSVDLPLLQQNNATATATPAPQAPGTTETAGYPPPGEILPAQIVTEGPQATNTPTPIPIQGGEFNIPILLGVIAIITIILFAWVVLSRIED